MYPLEKLLLGTLIRLFIGKIDGVQNVGNEPLVIAANHSSYMDDLIIPYLIMVKIRRKFTVFVNSRYYKNYFLKKLLLHYGGIPVDVSKDVRDESRRRATNEKAIKEAVESLVAGRVFVIFPEGERSPNGMIQKAKTGVARVALTARVPVVPVGVKGSYDILPKGALLPKLKRADITIGNALHFDKYYGREKDHLVLEEVTSIVMSEIARLVGQDYEKDILSL